MELANKLFKGDRVIWIIFLFLCLVSIIEVYSASSRLAFMNGNYWVPIERHAKSMFLGFLAVLLLHNTPSKYFSIAILLMPVAIILLAVTLLSGSAHNNAIRWLSVFGYSLQPSEIGKLSCVVFIAFMLSRQKRFTPAKSFWIMLTGFGSICLLIVFDNLSTAVILFTVCLLMMYIGQVSLKKLSLLLVGLILIGGCLFTALHNMTDEQVKSMGLKRASVWKTRIDTWLTNRTTQPENTTKPFELTDKNWQETHAKIAIARGGSSPFGMLPGGGTQREFLPEAYSDFIYAIIIEELGLVIGGLGVLMLYMILMFRIAIIARKCDKLFPKYLVLGCGLMIVIQALVHIAVSVDIIPITGQPLPLISRGGTSVVLTCVYFGIILSVSRYGAGIGAEENDDQAPLQPVPETSNTGTPITETSNAESQNHET